MIRLMNAALFACAVIMLMASPISGERRSLLLQPGDVLPPLTGQTLTAKQLDLPAAAQGNVAVVIFSFSRAGGRDARNWAQRVSKDYPRLDVYNVIFLESVPRLLRGMVVAGIRSRMPPASQDRSVILYLHQSSWEQKLDVTNGDNACVLVLGRDGRIRGMTIGPFAEAAYTHVREEIRP